MFLISPNWLILPMKKGILTVITPSKWDIKGVTEGSNWALFFLHYFLFWSISWKSAQLPKHFEIHVCSGAEKKHCWNVQRPLLTKVWCPRCRWRRMTGGCTLCDRASNTERAVPSAWVWKCENTPDTWPGWWLGTCSLCSGSLVLHRTSWEVLEISPSDQPLPESHSKLLNYKKKQKK